MFFFVVVVVLKKSQSLFLHSDYSNSASRKWLKSISVVNSRSWHKILKGIDTAIKAKVLIWRMEMLPLLCQKHQKSWVTQNKEGATKYPENFRHRRRWKMFHLHPTEFKVPRTNCCSPWMLSLKQKGFTLLAYACWTYLLLWGPDLSLQPLLKCV